MEFARTHGREDELRELDDNIDLLHSKLVGTYTAWLTGQDVHFMR